MYLARLATITREPLRAHRPGSHLSTGRHGSLVLNRADVSPPPSPPRPLRDPREEHPSRSYDAIVLDVDGTLYDARRMRQELLRIFVRRGMRAPLGAWRAARVLRAYRMAHESLRGTRWDDLSRAQLQHAADRLDVDINEVRRVVEDWFERTPIPAVARAAAPNLARDLQRLRASGARLAVLSDYPPVPKLEALGVAHLLDHVNWSQRPEIGALKPDPAGLLHTLRSLDVAPERALYVGDRPEVDEAVAISAGCRPMLIGGRPPLRPTTRVFPALGHFADWFLRAPDE